jgi:transposase
MYIHRVKKSGKNKTYVSKLLRKSYRNKDGKVCNETIANLTKIPDTVVDKLEQFLKNCDVENLNDVKTLKQIQGKSYGGLKVIYEIAKKLGITKAFGTSPHSKLALIMLSGIIQSQNKSKNYIANYWAPEQAIEEVIKYKKYFNEDSFYSTLNWLTENQREIEKKLWKLKNTEKKSKLFLYDITSSYVEGENIDLTNFGYNRDGKKGKKQIVIGLMNDVDGDPICVEVFSGNTRDNQTVESQLEKIQKEFNVEEMIFIGDRGMIKSAQIDQITKHNKWCYITAITKPQIEKLIKDKVLKYELFDEKLCEIEMNGLRYILKRNPYRAQEIESNLTSRINWCRNKIDEKNIYLKHHKKASPDIALNTIKKIIAQRKLNKILDVIIKGRTLELVHDLNAQKIHLRLAGCYVIKTNVEARKLDKETIHQRYKDLIIVEQSFRILKTGFLNVRPIFVRKENHVRGHVFICMLALKIINYINKYLHELNFPLDYIWQTLSSIHFIINEFDGQCFKTLPHQLNKNQQLILDTLNIKLPVKL